MRPGERKKIHPRVRGEEYAVYIRPRPIWESPPRARGRVGMVMTTNPMTRKNHPRVRGEETHCRSSTATTTESPPRARGRAGIARFVDVQLRNHPRVRGEESTAIRRHAPHEESPPRARGRGLFSFSIMSSRGITPACAGKRLGLWPLWLCDWNHPRVRGEESNENAAFEGMDIPPKCKFFVLFRNVLRVPCDSRARGSKAIRLSSIRACYMLCVPNTRADHRVFHGGALFVSDIPVIAKWN